MTIATRRTPIRSRQPRGGILAEIAARRLADIRPELDHLGRDGLRTALRAAPPPRLPPRALRARRKFVAPV